MQDFYSHFGHTNSSEVLTLLFVLRIKVSKKLMYDLNIPLSLISKSTINTFIFLSLNILDIEEGQFKGLFYRFTKKVESKMGLQKKLDEAEKLISCNSRKFIRDIFFGFYSLVQL